MKRFAIAAVCVLAACAERGAIVVTVAPLPTSAPIAETGTLLADCRIIGTGERPTDDSEAPEFGLFVSKTARTPTLVLGEPSNANVTWSKFPSSTSEANARAHVDLGGQSHLRFAGWAALGGRRFSAARRLYVEPGHLWARVGAPLEMMAVEGGVAVARVVTPFGAPKTLAVHGACDAVVYQREAPERKEDADPKTTGVALNRDTVLDLYAAPSGRVFTSITVDGEGVLSLGIVERRAAFTHVLVEEGDVGFDAWVRSAQISEDDVSGIGLEGFSTTSRCGGTNGGERGVLVRDAPLFVGASPVAVADAVVEKNAEIIFDTTEAKTVGRDVVMSFVFVDGMFRAAGDDARMWVSRDAIVQD